MKILVYQEVCNEIEIPDSVERTSDAVCEWLDQNEKWPNITLEKGQWLSPTIEIEEPLR